jgi:DNA mismatch repair protein MutH
MPPKLTIQEILDKLPTICGANHICPIQRNKGKPGHFLETLLGIAHTPDPLDCEDGEVKCFPLKKKGDTYCPKETIAITMLNPELLKTSCFEESKCYLKLKRTLYIPYLREDDTIRFFPPKLIELEKNPELFELLKTDYDTIRKEYLETNLLTAKTGKFLQNRTKGAGHGSTSRAFYLRTQFVEKYLAPSLTSKSS